MIPSLPPVARVRRQPCRALITETTLRRFISQYQQTRRDKGDRLLLCAAGQRSLMSLVDQGSRRLEQDARTIWMQAAHDADVPSDQREQLYRRVAPGFNLLIADLRKFSARPDYVNRGSLYRKRNLASRGEAQGEPGVGGRRPGRNPQNISDTAFSRLLAGELARHDDTLGRLHRDIVGPTDKLTLFTLMYWTMGTRAPKSVRNLVFIDRIEGRYGLDRGALRRLTPLRSAALRGLRDAGDNGPRTAALSWHLPDDFPHLDPGRREEILDWARRNTLPGETTRYGAWQSFSSRDKHALSLHGATAAARAVPPPYGGGLRRGLAGQLEPCAGAALQPGRAALRLDREVTSLVHHKTRDFCPVGESRIGHWSPATAQLVVRKLEALYGAVQSRGPTWIDPARLSLAHLMFPALSEWYLDGRAGRRGFYTCHEYEIVRICAALCRRPAGWIRQNPGFAADLSPLEGLISQEDVATARSDWDGACDRFVAYAATRCSDVQRVALRHRDAFEAIGVVLQHPRPLELYVSISDEIARHLPDGRAYERSGARILRAKVAFELAVQTGLRQRNLRELLLCPPGAAPRPEMELERRGRGEIRFDEQTAAWKILLPRRAFKNARSSYFQGRSLELSLSDVGSVYESLETYVAEARPLLLGRAADPGTLFVKGNRKGISRLELSGGDFYQMWFKMIQRFGVYNPYTGRGAIAGLLPHGPHAVRDVIATHVLKTTGSFELAGFAIQDAAATVMRHYARFAPTEKAALAAQLIKTAWTKRLDPQSELWDSVGPQDAAG